MNNEKDLFLGLVECADESILALNPLLQKKGYLFKGYNYDEFVKHRLDLFTNNKVLKSSNHLGNTNYIIDSEKVSRDSSVLELVKNLGITVDFDRTSWRNKVFFLEKSGQKQITIEQLGLVSEFQVVCYRLQQILSIYTSYPLRINFISYQSNTYSWRFQHPEYSKHKYPNRKIFDNQSIHSEKLTEEKRFIELVERNLSFSINQEIKTINFDEIEFSLTGKEYIDFAIQLYYQANQIPLNNPNASLNMKTKLALYISCLESLFNVSPIQVAHTLARHYSILLWNPSVFITNYKLMKFYYELRNSFIHGVKNNKMKSINQKVTNKVQSLGLTYPRNLQEVLDELDSNVKFIIKLVMLENKSKVELFETLNSRGQDPNEYYENSTIPPKPY